MNNKYITIDGVEYLATPVNNKLKTGYERVEKGGVYYSQGAPYGQFVGVVDSVNNRHFNEGLYENSKDLSENNKRADALFRKLRQWQALNDKPVDWYDTSTKKFHIYYDYQNETILTTLHNQWVRSMGQIYFSSIDKAREAVEVFKPELLWYFTKYRQRLDEPVVV